MNPNDKKAIIPETPQRAILNELNEMLRELNREIAAYGGPRAMSLEVLRDLLEERRAACLQSSPQGKTPQA